MNYKNTILKCKGLSVKQIDKHLKNLYQAGFTWNSGKKDLSIVEVCEYYPLDTLRYICCSEGIFYKTDKQSNADSYLYKFKEVKYYTIKDKLK